jgi:hypothetical protein
MLYSVLASKRGYALVEGVVDRLQNAKHSEQLFLSLAEQMKLPLMHILTLFRSYAPVTAHREGLQSALVSLGYALIEALPASDAPQMRLELAAHRCRYGIVAGLYADVDRLTTEALRQGMNLVGDTRQPLPALSHCGGAGVFVADAILNAIGAKLKVSHHKRRSGLGAVLQSNPQMQLV